MVLVGGSRTQSKSGRPAKCAQPSCGLTGEPVGRRKKARDRLVLPLQSIFDCRETASRIIKDTVHGPCCYTATRQQQLTGHTGRISSSFHSQPTRERLLASSLILPSTYQDSAESVSWLSCREARNPPPPPPHTGASNCGTPALQFPRCKSTRAWPHGSRPDSSGNRIPADIKNDCTKLQTSCTHTVKEKKMFAVSGHYYDSWHVMIVTADNFLQGVSVCVCVCKCVCQQLMGPGCPITLGSHCFSLCKADALPLRQALSPPYHFIITDSSFHSHPSKCILSVNSPVSMANRNLILQRV